MKKRLAVILLACMIVLCASGSEALADRFSSGYKAGGTAVSNVKAVAYSATQIKVSWTGSASSYTVNYGVSGGEFVYYDQVSETSCLISVAPETKYEITVEPLNGTESEIIYVTTPSYSTTREYSYKYSNCAVYCTSADSRDDFWEDSSRTEISEIQGAYMMGAGEIRDYWIGFSFRVKTSSSDKRFDYVVVLYAPGSVDRYITSGSETFDKDYTNWNYAAGINDILQTYLTYNESFAPGKYYVDIYFNGWLGGEADFYIE